MTDCRGGIRTFISILYSDMIKNDTEPKLDIGKAIDAIKKYRRLYYISIPLTMAIVMIISLGFPNYYRCKVTLVPETNVESQYRKLGILSSMSSTFRSLGSSNLDAITPDLYPDLITTLDFTAKMFDIKIKRDSDDACISYYDYLRYYQKLPWWTAMVKSAKNWLNGEEIEKRDSVNLFRLTKEQKAMSNVIQKKVVCTIDAKTDNIIIDVTDQDPVVAALVADTVRQMLQESLTEYRTKKARHNLQYIEKLHKEAKRNYDKACEIYADFMDSNQDVLLESVIKKQEKLENEMQLYFNNYNKVSEQLIDAKAKVMEDTPVFTTLVRATIPLEKDGPHRIRIVAFVTFLVIIIITIVVTGKEGVLKSLFRGFN